jgi:hypothetical protein
MMDEQKRRYRICSVCGKRWNVSLIGPNPKKYIGPCCAKKEKPLQELALRRRQSKYNRPQYIGEKGFCQ